MHIRVSVSYLGVLLSQELCYNYHSSFLSRSVFSLSLKSVSPLFFILSYHTFYLPSIKFKTHRFHHFYSSIFFFSLQLLSSKLKITSAGNPSVAAEIWPREDGNCIIVHYSEDDTRSGLDSVTLRDCLTDENGIDSKVLTVNPTDWMPAFTMSSTILGVCHTLNDQESPLRHFLL